MLLPDFYRINKMVYDKMFKWCFTKRHTVDYSLHCMDKNYQVSYVTEPTAVLI